MLLLNTGTTEMSAYIKDMMKAIMKEFPKGEHSQVTYKASRGNSILPRDFGMEMHGLLSDVIGSSEHISFPKSYG